MIWSAWGRRLVALPGVSAFGSFLGLGSGVLTFLQTPSSANLAAALTDETGTGTVVFSSAIREKLTGDRTYYVRTDGSDSNTGLVDSAGGAFLTIQAALNAIATIDFNGFTVLVQVRSGTFAGAISVPVTVGQGGPTNLVISGDAGTPSNVVITNRILVNPGARVAVQNFRISNASGVCLNVGTAGFLYFSNLEFNTASSAHIFAEGGGAAIALGNYAIVGGAAQHIWVRNGAVVNTDFRTVTLTGTPAITTYALCQQATYLAGAMTFSGSATGTRYSVSLNGVINTVGGGATYLPGNVGGATATGGQYV